MKKSKSIKTISRFFIIAVVLFLLFAAAFVVYAVNEGFMATVKDHVKNMLYIFSFNIKEGDSIVYLALSPFLLALIVCWFVFLVAGFFVTNRKESKSVWLGILFTLVVIGVYLVLASGLQRFAGVLRAHTYNISFFAIVAMMVFGILYAFLSIVLFFWSIVEIFMDDKEEDEVSEERVRELVKEELLKSLLQPETVIVRLNEGQTVKIVSDKSEEEVAPVEQAEEQPEEVQPEEQPQEEVKEEEHQALTPRVTFWDAAREVWPQLDNPKPLPKEEPKPEPAPQEEQVQPEPEQEAEEEAPAEEVDPALQPEESWARGKRQPFLMRIITADLDTKVNYNELKNELLSYGVKSRLSRGGDTFRLGGKSYARIYLVGKTLKVYLALNPEDYKDTTIPIEDVGYRPNYAEMPLLFKVRSGLSVRRCKELIKAACEKDGLEKKETQEVNWVNELRRQNAERTKKDKQSITQTASLVKQWRFLLRKKFDLTLIIFIIVTILLS